MLFYDAAQAASFSFICAAKQRILLHKFTSKEQAYWACGPIERLIIRARGPYYLGAYVLKRAPGPLFFLVNISNMRYKTRTV